MADGDSSPSANNSTSTNDSDRPKFVRKTGAVRPSVLIPKKANIITHDSNSAQTPSSLAAYDDEWRRLFSNTLGAVKTCRVPLEQLKMNALSGNMRNSRFRSVIWRILLGVLSTDSSLWQSELKVWRDKYEQLKKEFLVDPHEAESGASISSLHHSTGEDCNNNVQRDDPLSQDQASTWNRYFNGKEIKREIMQDVVRTFPEVEFFQDESIRANLINVLFCFSQISKVRYRQGMHEILAPLIFVLQYDRMTYHHFLEAPFEVSPIIEEGKDLFTGDYLEHDSFSMFCQIMKIIEDWYYVKEDDIEKNRALTPSTLLNIRTILSKDELVEREPFRNNNLATKSSCEGVDRLLRIQNILLKQYDFELFLHLEKLEISPQMYGLRWLRLMFGREFPLQDLLIVWDAIFATQNEFVLVDYIYIAMLQLIRDHILNGDFADILYLLMRYPQGNDVTYVLETALHLYKPDCYHKPKEPSCQRMFLSSQSSNASRAKIYRSRNTLNTTSRDGSFRTKKNEIFAKLSSQFSFSNIKRSVSTMMNSSKSTQNLNNLDEQSPKPIRRTYSKTRAARPVSMMVQPDQSHLLNFNSLEVSKPLVKNNSPTRIDNDFDSSWKSSLESAPVTPTQEYYNQNDFTKFNTISGRARAVSGSDSSVVKDYIDCDLEDPNSKASVIKELLRLCGYCSKELDSCIDQISGYVTDYVHNQTENSAVQQFQTSRNKYKTPYDDLDSLRQTLIRLNHIRDLLSGANGDNQDDSKAILSETKVRSASPNRSLLSKSFSTHSLVQYLPSFQIDDCTKTTKLVELKSFDNSSK